MATMETIVDEFISKYKLNEQAKDDCINVINNCFKAYVDHMHREFITTAIPGTDTSVAKKTKANTGSKESFDNPAEAESVEQLQKCTIQVLGKFCKEKQLKIGGKKDEVVNRVWRFLQGESSDEDRTPKNRPKKKPATDFNVCCGLTKSNEKCVIAGTDQGQDGKWYCWRHIEKTKPATTDESAGELTDDQDSIEPSETKPKKSNKKTKKTIPLDLEE